MILLPSGNWKAISANFVSRKQEVEQKRVRMMEQRNRETALPFAVIFAAALLFAAILSDSMARIIVEKKDGGLKGYNKVVEVHEDSLHSLRCQGEGWEACAWTMPPDAHHGFPELIDYAEARIAEGKLTGTYSQKFDGKLCFVKWTAQDLDNLRIELWTEDEEAPQREQE